MLRGAYKLFFMSQFVGNLTLKSSCLIYEVLAGGVPFIGCSDIEVVSKLMKGELPAPLDALTLDENKSLNKKLRQLVKKCWSIKPEQRPRCTEILREIENNLIVREPHGPNRVTARNRSGRPGFLLRAPGSILSTNLNRGQKIFEEIYQGPFISCF
jgi:serine/threonine protein kinase